jgi:AcrR family transcriptional regulator
VAVTMVDDRRLAAMVEPIGPASRFETWFRLRIVTALHYDCLTHMGRPRIHDARTAHLLLDAAEQLLAAGGPEVVSVRDVARTAGTTTRGVYSAYGSKAALIEALAARGYDTLTESVDAVAVTDDPAEDLVNVGLQAFRQFALSRPHLYRLTFERQIGELSQVDSVVEAAMRSYAALAKRIERWRQAAASDGHTVGELAFMFHGMCAGLASNELARQPRPDGAELWRHVPEIEPERLWRDALHALLHGISAGMP